MNSVYPTLILYSSISTVLPFLASALVFRQANKYRKDLLPLLMFFILAAATELTLYVLNSQGNQSAWLFSIYTLIEYVLITIVLLSWQTKPKIANMMRLSIPIYILLFVFIKTTGLEFFFEEKVNYVTRPIALLCMSTFAFLTLQNLWRQTPANLSKDYRFWMLLAMVLYYSTSLGLFALMYTKNQEFLVLLFKFHAVVNILHNILFTIGVLRVRGQKGIDIQTTQASDYSLS